MTSSSSCAHQHHETDQLLLPIPENGGITKDASAPNHTHSNTNNTNMEEYGSLAVAVIENEETHEPMILHDLTGPMLLKEEPNLERTDSLVSMVSHATTIDDLPKEDDLLLTEPTAGQATIASEIASMTKNLIGCGALSLCNGLALAGNTPSTAIAGNLWILLLAIIFAYFCWLIGKICHLTGRTTYRGIWQDTVGNRGANFVTLANGLKAALADLAYATILSDTLRSLLLGVHFQVSRGICLLIVTICFILPLCLMKNLHVLAPFSVLGTAGILFTAGTMAWRYYDGSYQPGGQYYGDLSPQLQPFFGTTNHSWNTSILPFVCMVYEAYVMHYNAARFYTELKDKSLSRFGVAVGSSFGLSALLYMAIASFGYLTFGGNSSGYILNNYSPYDPLACVSRLAVGLAVLMAYPIVFFGVRDSVLDIMEVSMADQLAGNHNLLTLALLCCLTVVAVFVTDLGLINAVGGGLVTTPIVFLFPTIMFRRAFTKWLAADHSFLAQLEVSWATGLTVLGAIFGLAGAWIAITAALAPVS